MKTSLSIKIRPHENSIITNNSCIKDKVSTASIKNFDTKGTAKPITRDLNCDETRVTTSRTTKTERTMTIVSTQ